ncbi:FG-GAP-like repeat-containing protein [Ichthyenterobacterium magnum]|uniref:Putative secreted protein (Por secretion system target) n=1 Tax=Ichthyenterobacterium magnum TaxID=1230530 RepID=A0A420DVI5_9FLAO|nr:FG-GAP-like repeat-containing protein [Ichthyenterobacterium magnum]RKE98232.1 putative secreted protein (Por secretion system target) [Ichthyenterobacterium magnum]
MKFSCIVYVIILIQNPFVFSQNFQRIEAQSGLNLLENNTGVAVADYDGDNDLDIFVVAKQRDESDGDSMSQLFRNNNDGTFTDVTIEAGLTNLHPFEDSHRDDPLNTVVYQDYKWGVSWGDYDNDGDPDLFLTNAYRVMLFNNLGDGTFTNVTSNSGISDYNGCFNTSALWFDYNKDGLLDIYISDYRSSCGRNTLFKNNGNGTFSDVSNLFVSDGEGSMFTFMSVPIDVNNDGWLDLYLANDFGRNNLYINQNGNSFIEQSESFGLDDSRTGMGLSIGDYNNNGSFDIYLSNINANALYTDNGNNFFNNVASQMNVESGEWAWSPRFADFDLDGDEDLFVLNGYDNFYNHNIYFENLLNEGQNGFSNISTEINIDEFSYSLSNEAFDYDNDGDLEIFITNKEGSAFFYDNKTIDLSQPDNLHWFKIALQGTLSNRDAIGTTVSITTNNGTYHRYYHGASLFSQSLQPIHFGVGADDEILELKITWPLGLVETYTNLNVDETILAIEGQGYQTLNIQPSQRVVGCTNPNSCNYDVMAVIDDGSCTFLESSEISGNINSFYLQDEVYTYTLLDQSSQVNWDIIGGEIIETLSNNSIRVQWGLEQSGKIIASEYNTCSSQPVELLVDLDAPTPSVNGIHSVARLWNEALLEAIRGDFARPTVHARNLFHTSIAMYDAWAIYDNRARTYLIGNSIHNYSNFFNGFTTTETIEDARKKSISYAVYRLLTHRFSNSPSSTESIERFNLLMQTLGYDINNTSTDYSTGDSAALGNFIAESIINYGNTDGSREASSYDNSYYSPINTPLAPIQPGSGNITNPNRWQPLSLDTFIDQSGNLIIGETPEFLSPEWGNVLPFSLGSETKTNYERSGHNFSVYFDPGNPPFLNSSAETESSEAYKWGFTLVSIWGSHLDPNDNTMWDISPRSIGNIDISQFPNSFTEYPDFYNLLEGGDIGQGRSTNPITNAPYEQQIVPRGDYTRVLAEFWADGPDSETPPGHWFTLLNHVNDHPLFEKKLGGEGEILNPLEWDVKAYFTLGGTMHDAAIAAWSIKGWYDYIRPISAIRFMTDNGQSTDESIENYDISGIPLRDGYVEIVEDGDELEGREGEHIGKIKLYTWKGHDFIGDSDTDQAGVGWILAENWWPYQRPSFVTPPFAGFVSGHSTYSRAAAEVMTLLTGDEFFPGGYGEFIARKNEFLVFEEGPSMDIKLQWATYRDASDQCSLSRIWGGIHPPADDIPGRIIGKTLGINSYNYAVEYFDGKTPESIESNIYPNPVISNELFINNSQITDTFILFDIKGSNLQIDNIKYNPETKVTHLKFPQSISTGIYILRMNNDNTILIFK